MLTRAIFEMEELPQQLAHRNGLSVAADENWFVYTVDTSAEHDLMMIEPLEQPESSNPRNVRSR